MTTISRDPVAELYAACKAAGSQKAWADTNGLSPQYVCDVLQGRREPGDSILSALGLKKVVTYHAATPHPPQDGGPDRWAIA